MEGFKLSSYWDEQAEVPIARVRGKSFEVKYLGDRINERRKRGWQREGSLGLGSWGTQDVYLLPCRAARCGQAVLPELSALTARHTEL